MAAIFDLRITPTWRHIQPITIWNSLPDNVVSSTSINMFKNRLDNFCMLRMFMFNWKADLTGTGDRRKSHCNTNFDYL